MSGIQTMKQLLAMKCSSSQENQEEINQRIEQVVAEATCKFILSVARIFINHHFHPLNSRQDSRKLDRVR